MDNVKLEKMADFFDLRSEIYEEKHLAALEGGVESKRSLVVPLAPNTKTLLDFGIGTGLELDEIYARFPDIDITGLDISSKMLELLRKKYPHKKLNLLQQNYLDYDFGIKKYDAIISSMTMHHYRPSVKISFYQKIHDALVCGGVYIENDYILSEIDLPDASILESRLFTEYEQLKKEKNLSPSCVYHFDTPCTLQHQFKILNEAGFSDVRIVWQRQHNITLVATRI